VDIGDHVHKEQVLRRLFVSEHVSLGGAMLSVVTPRRGEPSAANEWWRRRESNYSALLITRKLLILKRAKFAKMA
jgi:hypothetical protein